MRIALAAALLLTLGVFGNPAYAAKEPAAGDAPRARRAEHSDTPDLLRLEDEWAKGLVRRDGSLFRRLLAKGFVYTENDRMMGRNALLRELTGGPERVSEARNEGMKIHPFGDTAAVTGWLVVRGSGPSGPFHRRYRFTDTWARVDGAWQLVAAHDYVAPSGGR